MAKLPAGATLIEFIREATTLPFSATNKTIVFFTSLKTTTGPLSIVLCPLDVEEGDGSVLVNCEIVLLAGRSLVDVTEPPASGGIPPAKRN